MSLMLVKMKDPSSTNLAIEEVVQFKCLAFHLQGLSKESTGFCLLKMSKLRYVDSVLAPFFF